jgi:hypothetical protein
MATLAFAAMLVTVEASPAAAASWGCPGSQIDVYDVSNGSVVYSQVHLFFSAVNGGTNCAVNVKVGSLYGASTWVGVAIQRCDSYSGGGVCQGPQIGDPPGSHVYLYYAGPVTVTQTAGKCVGLWASTDDRSGGYASFQANAVHCG